jgi:hypothetical protein
MQSDVVETIPSHVAIDIVADDESVNTPDGRQAVAEAIIAATGGFYVRPKEAPNGDSLMPDSTRDATWVAWNADEHDDQVRRLLAPTSEHCGAATTLGLTPTVSVSNHACVWALTILDEKSGTRVSAHVAVYAIDDESAASAAEIIGDTTLRSAVRKSLPDVGEADDRFPPNTYHVVLRKPGV